tara:strand:- start:26152 stop:27105 length:954 start_codon:yes stop_codon:yes gene_type:complete
MAISVDTVYQRVLALANKEQRGYITPQEFNLLSNQAQISIFESYFYNKSQRERQEPDMSTEVDETNLSELIARQLSPFQSFEAVTSGHTFPATVTVSGVAYDVFQTGRVFLGDEPCQKITIGEAQRMRKSIRHMAVTDNQAPFYTDNRVSGRDIVVYAGGVDGSDDNEEPGVFTDATCDYNNDPTITHDANPLIVVGLGVSGTGIPTGATVASINSTTSFELSAATTGGSVTNGTLTFSDITVECFRVPTTVNWTYVVVNNKAMYNSTLAVDFELHKSETDTVVMKILELASIIMNKPGLVQIAQQNLANETQIQKL